jgi:hypothetical protein
MLQFMLILVFYQETNSNLDLDLVCDALLG